MLAVTCSTSARQCEEDVFLQAFGNTRTQLEEEYGPYDDQSVFVAVSDDSGHVVGACRLITPGPGGLKTLNDVGREPWGVDGLRAARAAGIDPENAWDVATLGVRRDYRGSKMSVAIALYHAIVVSTRVNEVGTDHRDPRRPDRAGSSRRPTSSCPRCPAPGPAEYLGSPASTPVYGHCAGMVDGQRRMNPDAYRLMSLGIGLDGISIPEQSAFELRSRLAPVVGACRHRASP